jgi:hypothetical protein
MVQIQLARNENQSRARIGVGKKNAESVKKCEGDYLLGVGNKCRRREAWARIKTKQNPVREYVARNPWARKKKTTAISRV